MMQTVIDDSPKPTKPKGQEPLDIEQLFSLYADDVLRVCCVYLGKRSLAEDAFQDVFVKVCCRAESFRGETPVRFWLLAIARNVCRDYLRSSWLSRVISYEEWTERKVLDGSYSNRRKAVRSDTQENSIINRLDKDSPLLHAVYGLPPRYKDVILLRYYFDLNNQEIAEQLKITESTVRSRLFRARKMLSPFMEREEIPHVQR